MSKRTEERREHPRSRRGFVPPAEASGDGLINSIENISPSGVLCHTQRPVAEMTKMSIVLHLPNPVSREVEAEGIVIRCVAEDSHGDTFKVAILYTKVSEDDQEAIRIYVDHDLLESAEG